MECSCDRLRSIKTLWRHDGDWSRESLQIMQCLNCGQLWKVRYQWNAGSGCDNIYLRPGESDRGYTFTDDEAASVLRELETGEDWADGPAEAERDSGETW